MARIRTIKPEFFTSEDIVSLSPLARLFYVSLWCEADREGRFEWKPKTFKLRYLPGDDCDVDALGQELIDAGLIVLYEADGKLYAEIPTFAKHQIINNREAASEIPARKPTPSGTREARVKAEGKEGKEGKDGRVPSSADANTPADTTPPALVTSIPLIDKTEHPITEAMAAEWAEAYPAVDVTQQLREMRAWCLANPKNRKTATGIARFVTTWLGREQDKAPRVNGGSQKPGSDGVGRSFV